MTLLLLLGGLAVARILALYGLEAVCRTSWGKARMVYPLRANQHLRRKQEFGIYLLGIALESILLFFIVKFAWIQFNPTTVWGVFIALLSFMLIVEPIYYFYHRLLHTKYIYKKYHIHHHQALVPSPVSGFYFTLTERLSYTVLFMLPLALLSVMGLLSISILIIYTILFDIANGFGHTNLKIFSEKYQKSVWHLFFYSPDFHGAHHKYFRTNYSLFMPLWDKLFGTYRH